MKIKIVITLLTWQMWIPHVVWTQNNRDIKSPGNNLESKSQVEKDWLGVDTIKTYFSQSPKELEWYYSANFLEQRRFEDGVEKKRLSVLETFLDKYPKEDLYYRGLKYYLNYFFEPKFIADNIPDSLVTFLSQDSKLTKTDRRLFLSQLRALPIDKVARDRWLKKGNTLVQKFLESDASMEQKAEIEKFLVGRDLRLALFLYEYSGLQKKSMEYGYWERFDAYYWEPLRLRVEALIFKYPELEYMSSFVEKFITIVSRKYLSPELNEPYWRHFFDITDSIHGKVHGKGVEGVHQLAKENLKALKSLNDFNDSQPLQMKFTDMDGTKIDLERMRGKVVLLDFWSINCGPCIQEMPHVKALYDKYRDQGFEVLGIAAHGDSAKESVLKIINKQKINWPQLLDKGTGVPVSYHSLFKITRLPTVWLLDKDGKVVDKNARGDRLESLIQKYLGVD
jgi:thiol-disulfide isomerase/thioredoxin